MATRKYEFQGNFECYEVDRLTEDMSFLEALDHLVLVGQNKKVIAYEYDCRETFVDNVGCSSMGEHTVPTTI